MLGTILKAGACAVGVLLCVGVSYCTAQTQVVPTTQTDGLVGTALLNQGRYPTPVYVQEEQPYALTGNVQETKPWPRTPQYYMVGNARIILQPAP